MDLLRPATTPSIALTVDLEEWNHGLFIPPEGVRRVEEETHWLLQLFSEFNARATFFVLADIAIDHPELLARIAGAGHEIGFHGHEHIFLANVGPDAFARSLREWKPRLEDLVQSPIRGYRAPFFSVGPSTAWALPLLLEAGFEYDASIYPGPNDRYGWRDGPREPVFFEASDLVLFPVPLLHRRLPVAYSGGAYLRLLPSRVIAWGINRRIAQGRPGMIYVHPWEIAATAVRARRAPWRARLTRYPRQRAMRGRLRSLLADQEVRLGAMCDVIAGLRDLDRWYPRARRSHS
jgi:polysaccharide deacetylase family protein (PEP-CTERM system associated)